MAFDDVQERNLPYGEVAGGHYTGFFPLRVVIGVEMESEISADKVSSWCAPVCRCVVFSR
jgi:hypothetical protein